MTTLHAPARADRLAPPTRVRQAYATARVRKHTTRTHAHEMVQEMGVGGAQSTPNMLTPANGDRIADRCLTAPMAREDIVIVEKSRL